MKKIYLFPIVALIFSLSSCLNEDYLKYDASRTDAVYIDATVSTDSIFYNFGYLSITDTLLKVPVKLMGLPRDYDREFKIQMVNDKYESDAFIAAKEEYYEVPETVIFPKGAVTAEIPVKLIRNKELESVRAILTLKIAPSDDFSVRGHDEYTITFDDKMPNQPAWWSQSVVIRKFGTFSKVKFQKFLSFFWEMEEKDPYFYGLFVYKYGLELNRNPIAKENPVADYPNIITKYIHQPLFDFQEDAEKNTGPDKITGVLKP